MADASEKSARWIAFRRGLHIAILGATAAWWALWDIQRHSAFLFFAVPVGAAFVVHLACYSLDKVFMGRRWTATDVLRLALWQTVSPTGALLLVATGFDAMYSRRLVGILWLVFAAMLAIVGRYRFRVAEGMKLQRVKSGEVYKRAFAMAKEMQTPLKRVYIVPTGKGQLTNAYGLSESIAVTDNYGKFLDRAELDFVIGHELGHVKGKHGRTKLLIMAIVFAAFAIVCFFFPPAFRQFRPLLDFLLLLGPMLTSYFLSRRFEYAADKYSVEFTHDAKAAIRALDNMYDFAQLPTRCNRIAELFLTHPSLEHRAAAIAEIAGTHAKNSAEFVAQTRDW